jgi:hypothetical protein
MAQFEIVDKVPLYSRWKFYCRFDRFFECYPGEEEGLKYLWEEVKEFFLKEKGLINV